MPPPTMITSWCESGMIDDHTATVISRPLRAGRLSLRTHNQGYSGRRLMTQRPRRAGHTNGIGAGLRALLLPATATAATTSTAAVASCCSTRWQQEYQQKHPEHGSWQ